MVIYLFLSLSTISFRFVLYSTQVTFIYIIAVTIKSSDLPDSNLVSFFSFFFFAANILCTGIINIFILGQKNAFTSYITIREEISELYFSSVDGSTVWAGKKTSVMLFCDL